MELTIEGERFRVEVEGANDRPTLLLSCALGSDLTIFDAQMAALLEHFRVVRYDPRGHGGSTTAGAPYSLARLGRDALAILDALSIETAHFLGLSMGGAVGLWLLVNAPQRIGRAVLAGTAARIGAPATWNARIAGVRAHGMDALAAAAMERWFSAAFRRRAPERVAAVEAVFRKTAVEGYAGGCAALRDLDLRTAIRAIDKEVLIVTGRDDEMTREADIAALTGAIAGARHVALDCRHISNIEQEAAFNAAVVGFLTAPVSARQPRPRTSPTPRRGGRASAARSPLKPTAAVSGTGTAARRAARGGADAKTTKPAARPAASTKAAAVKPKAPGPRKPASARPASETTRKPPKATAKARKAVAKTPAKTKPAKKSAASAETSPGTPKKAAPGKASPAKRTATKAPLGRRSASARRPTPKRPGGRKR